MNIVIIADAFPPSRSSAAVQLRDLSIAFSELGHSTTVLISEPELCSRWSFEILDGVQILRLKTLRSKGVSYFRRAISELAMPYLMMRGLGQSPLATHSWDFVVWYSPSIFLGPIARTLIRKSKGSGYLIVRDIFPEWAVDMGLMRRGLAFFFLRAIARNQYAIADTIGVQSAGNLQYFRNNSERRQGSVEVLHNWLANSPVSNCSIRISETKIAERTVFVYAGNIGVAQGVDILIDLAQALQQRKNIGFLFVGRGSDVERLRNKVKRLALTNVVFRDEIAPEEIPGLYAQCHVGLVALDPRHKTHNIPGKFVSYIRCGLPVLASVNPGNDLVQLIEKEGIGLSSTAGSAEGLDVSAIQILKLVDSDSGISDRCISLAKRMFSPQSAALQIIGRARPSSPHT